MFSKIYKIIYLYFFIIISIFLIYACSGKKLQSQRLVSEIIIDGKSYDWRDYRPFYNEDWKTIYAIANNDTSVSIMLQFREHHLAKNINIRGFTVWFNSAGDNEKNFGIHYEDKELMEHILNTMADRNVIHNLTEKNSEFNKTVEFKGTFALINEDRNIISDNNQNGIYAEAKYDQGNYCFEYKITKDANNIDPELFNLTLESDLEVGIEINAISEKFKEIIKEKMKSGMRPSGGKPTLGKRGGRMQGRRRADIAEPPGGVRENLL